MNTNFIQLDKLTNDELDFIKSEYMQDADSLILVVETGNGNRVHFIYRVSEDLAFHFSLLCEVGECYKQAYVDLLNEHKLKLQAKETANDYFEIVIPAN